MPAVYGSPNTTQFDLMTRAPVLAKRRPVRMKGGTGTVFGSSGSQLAALPALQALGAQGDTTTPETNAPGIGASKSEYDPTRAKRGRDVYASLLEQGMATSPTDMWGGLARLGQAAIGGLGMRAWNQSEKQAQDEAKQAFERMIQGGEEGGKLSNADIMRFMSYPGATSAQSGV